MPKKMKHALFWIFFFAVWLVGTSFNLMIDKSIGLNEAINQIMKAPLAVQSYVLLLGLLTFILGELLLYSYQERSFRHTLLILILLLSAYWLCQEAYFLLLALIGAVTEGVIFYVTRGRKDAITEILDEVLAMPLDEEEPIEEEQIALPEPEIVFEKVTYEKEQQEEIEQFLDALFAKNDSDDIADDEITEEEPLVQEILDDANDILEESEVKEEPLPEKKSLQDEEVTEYRKRLNREEIEDLGEFDEEIPINQMIDN